MDKISIFLDDIRPAPEGFIKCEHVYQVLNLLENLNPKSGIVEVLSLDNDLGENEPEGRKILDFLEEKHTLDNFKLPKKIIVHSANPVAKQYMNQVIQKLYGEN